MENPLFFDEGHPRWSHVRPKDAASLILVRREGGTVRVLMGERHKGLVFHPGRFVFPGGRMDPGDLRLRLETDLQPEVRAKVAAGISPARARGLALAAIRETFEETGILLGKKQSTLPRTRSPAWRRFLGYGVIPRLESLEFVARAITPPSRPRRFDARFFMAFAEDIAHSLSPQEASGELLSPLWVTLEEAHKLAALPITRCVLSEVEGRLAGPQDRTRPVPFYVPRRGKAVILSL